MIIRIFKCAVCGSEHKESVQNEGAPGWSQMIGVIFNGDESPFFCPEHKRRIMNFIDKMASVEGENYDLG